MGTSFGEGGGVKKKFTSLGKTCYTYISLFVNKMKAVVMEWKMSCRDCICYSSYNYCYCCYYWNYLVLVYETWMKKKIFIFGQSNHNFFSKTFFNELTIVSTLWKLILPKIYVKKIKCKVYPYGKFCSLFVLHKIYLEKIWTIYQIYYY